MTNNRSEVDSAGGSPVDPNLDLTFTTAIITMRDHREGTAYAAHVMHKNGGDRTLHEELGFYDGWGTVGEQLAALVESRS